MNSPCSSWRRPVANATESQKVATGFHRNTQINQEGGIDPNSFASTVCLIVLPRQAQSGLDSPSAVLSATTTSSIQSRKRVLPALAFLNNQDEPSIKVFGSLERAKQLSDESKRLEAAIHAYVTSHRDAVSQWEAASRPPLVKSSPKTQQPR